MTNVDFSAKEFVVKAASASRAIADVDLLRAHNASADGEAFMVGRTLFVWVGADKTADDGLTSVKPASVASQAAGRYRRAGLLFPLAKK